MHMLLDDFTEIFEKKKDEWKYYSRLKLDFPFSDEYSADKFIINYLQYSGKFDLYLKTDLDRLRKLHTVSVFFLGIQLVEKLQNLYNYNIERFVESYNTKINIKRAFSFYWFLTLFTITFRFTFPHD